MVARPKNTEVTLKNVKSILPGKESKSEFWIVNTFLHHTLLRVKIHTGRTHQIRVHMHAYGHPVVGDTLYFQKRWLNKNAPQLDRLFLHAAILAFEDQNGETQTFEAALPEKLEQFLHKLK